MNRIWKYGLGLAAAGLVRPAWAQVPAAAPPPPGAVVAAPVAAAPVDPNMPGGVMGNLIKTCNYMKAKCCASPMGQLLNNSLKPVGALTGGLVPPLCPPDAVNPADLAKPPDSVGGAAARIKADSAGAAARVAAVHYLAHADCHYWPEASAALIAALRADRNECVRFAAAQALGTGCCCNTATVLALTICVSESEQDGNPSETSERVRAAASVALANCVSRAPAPPLEMLPAPVPPEKPPVEPPREPGSSGSGAAGTATVTPAVYYQRPDVTNRAVVMRKAKEALDQYNKSHVTEATTARSTARGSEGLIGMAMNAMNPLPATPAPAEAGTAPQPATVEVVKDQHPALMPVPMPVPAAAPQKPSPIPTLPVISGQSPAVTPAGKPVAPAPAVQPVAPPKPVSGPTLSVISGQSPTITPAGRPTPPPSYSPAPQQPTQGPALPSMPAAPSVSPYGHQAPVPAVPQAVAQKPAQSPVLVPVSAPSSGISQVSYQAAPPHSPSAAPAPARPPQPAGPTAEDVTSILKNGTRAEDRGWAAGQMEHMDWHAHQQLVTSLMIAARTDADPAVRLTCVGTLVRMKVDTPEVQTTYHAVAAVDGDQRVRDAALSALARTAPDQSRAH